MQKQLNEIYELLQTWKAERKLSVESQRAGLLGNLCKEMTKYFKSQSDNERAYALCRSVVVLMSAMKEPCAVWDIHPNVVITRIIEDAILHGINDNILGVLATRAYASADKLGCDPYGCILGIIKEKMFTEAMNENEKVVFEFIKSKISDAKTDDFVYIYSNEIKESLDMRHSDFCNSINELKRSGALIVNDFNLLIGYKLPITKTDKDKQWGRG